MRIATYNVEWFTNLFDDSGRLLNDNKWSGRHDVKRYQQVEALGIVFNALDADAVMIIEAPDQSPRHATIRALTVFAERFGLRTNAAVMGFANDTQQEIALLFDPDVLEAEHDPLGSPRFDETYRIDLNTDASPEKVRWSKPPLELALRTVSGGRLRMIGVHAKSKAPHGARSRKEAMRIAIENRRKQLAQCIWLRERVDDHLDRGDHLIVLGDFNDGPGLDEYEKLFGRSSVEIVLGDGDDVQMYDPHPISESIEKPTSARFWRSDQKRWMETLLDYVMVSPGLRERSSDWRIWHPYRDEGVGDVPELVEALLTASDHFPVSVEVDL